MIWNYLIDNLLPIAIAIGGAIAWIFDRKKRDAEYKSALAANKQSEATALQGMQEVYDKFVGDVKVQIDSLKEENKDLKERVKELENELKTSNEEREKLSEQIKSFKEQSAKDSKLIISLKMKIESYEKELKSFRKEQQ